jgi:polar amino acid transport system substrate-binding protein
MTEVSDRLSIPFEFNQLPWKRSLVYLSEGKLDIILGIYWTKERAEKFYYTTPILKNEARVFVLKKNQFKFKELSDLIGRRGDIPLGGSFGEDFDQYAKAHLTLSALGNKEEHIGRLQLKRSDFFISDYADAIAVIHQKGLQDKIVALAKPVSTTYVYFAVSKASPCAHLVPEIVNTLEWLRHDNTLDKLSTKYLTQFK